MYIHIHTRKATISYVEGVSSTMSTRGRRVSRGIHHHHREVNKAHAILDSCMVTFLWKRETRACVSWMRVQHYISQ